MNHKPNTCPAGKPPEKKGPNTGDRINYVSSDGAVTVLTKVTTARRHPPHGYPVVCLQLRVKPDARRIQPLDGEEGLDVLLTHREVAAHIQALAEADPVCGGYRVPLIPEKPPGRKAYWDQRNAQRRERRQNNRAK